MPPPVRGFGGSIGIAEEVTWGTPVARTNWKEMVSIGLQRKVTRKPVPELGRFGAASTNHRFSYDESDFVGGPLSFNAAYDDSTILLLKHMLGANATTGAGPFTHTLTLASPVPIGLTLEMIKGTSNGTVTNVAEVFEGCKFAGCSLTATAGGLLVVESEVIGQTSGGETTPGSPTYTSNGERVRAHQSGTTVSFNSGTFACNSVKYTVSRPLERNQELGSKFTSEPVEQGLLEVMVEIRTKWQSSQWMVDFLSGAQSNLVQVFTGTASKTLTATAHNCVIDDVDQQTNDAGAVEQVIKLRAYKDATNQGLSLAFVNANASHSAN